MVITCKDITFFNTVIIGENLFSVTLFRDSKFHGLASYYSYLTLFLRYLDLGDMQMK